MLHVHTPSQATGRVLTEALSARSGAGRAGSAGDGR